MELIIAENEKIDRFSAIIKRRIDLSQITVYEFELIMREISEAKTEKEINSIMSRYNIN